MSWEANVWAIKQRMKLPQEQLVLIVLGNCADPDAIAFSTWPGRDHWWKYLSKITRLSRSSLFRHINTIVALGLASRTMLVLADGSKRPTITLHLDVKFDIEKEEGRYIDATSRPARGESHSETDVDNDPENTENAYDNSALEDENHVDIAESHSETVAPLSPTHGTDSVPPAGPHIDSSKSFSKDSPLPPSGGTSANVELWDQFVKAWGEPIQRMGVTRSAWERVATDKRPTVVAAAKGFWAYRRALTKPPSPQSAQSFIRDEAGWPQWLRYTPNADGSSALSPIGAYALASPEGRAICNLYELAGLDYALKTYMIKNGMVYYAKPIGPRLLPLAEAPSKQNWVEISYQQAGAWETLLRETIAVQTRKPLRAGSKAPWPWPPSSEGKLYTTGPPEALMSEDDYANI